MWLAGSNVRLVILVDICVDEAKASLHEVSQSSLEQDKDTQTILPFGLNTIDLETRDFEIIGTKILGRHETQQGLVRPVLGTIYLYRRTPGDELNINIDKEIIFFDGEQVPTDLEAYITPDDFDLPLDFSARNLPLPLEELKEEFPRAVKKQSQKVAEARAIEHSDTSSFTPSSATSFPALTLDL